jgi:D-proline reductase (dithiol) PrdB
MSHLSVNYDRSGFQADWNVAFPLDRLKELVRDKIVGSIAAFHYSFMGAISPVTRYEPKARELAGLLKQDQVDAVLLSPV